jgi:hypothetical protein
MKIFKSNLLGLALAGLILGACSQTATFEDADLANEQATAEKAGFNLSPFGTTSVENLREYSDTACATECINPDDPESWFYIEDRELFNPQIYIDYKVYQNATSIFYEFKIGTFNASNPTIASYLLDGVSTPINGTTFSLEFPLADGWQACDLVSKTFKIVRGGGGGGATSVEFTIDYKLVPVCVNEDDPDDECPEAFRYERDATDPNIITFYYTPKASKTNAEIQMTTPQIAGYEALDGKVYSTFGNPSSGGLRWNGDLVCGQEISFKIKFTPIGCTGLPSPEVNLVSTFNVKDLGGNKLTGQPITGICVSGS